MEGEESDRFRARMVRVQGQDTATLEAVQQKLEAKVSELDAFKVSAKKEEESLTERLENKDDEITGLHDKLLGLHRVIKGKNEKISVLKMQHQQVVIGRALSSSPKQKKVNNFMFTFTGPPIRRYTMESVFERVAIGRFNDSLMYCVMKLFKGRDEDTLVKLIAEYNQSVGRESAITVVRAGDGLPLILPEYKFPKNVILEKQKADIAGYPDDYNYWTNPTPRSAKAGR
jgi:hypothetical protein